METIKPAEMTRKSLIKGLTEKQPEQEGERENSLVLFDIGHAVLLVANSFGRYLAAQAFDQMLCTFRYLL